MGAGREGQELGVRQAQPCAPLPHHQHVCSPAGEPALAPSPAPSVADVEEPTETGSYVAPPGSFVPPPGSYVSYTAPSESGDGGPAENASYVPPPSSYTSFNPPAGSAAADSEFAPPSAPPSIYGDESASQAGDRAPSVAE